MNHWTRHSSALLVAAAWTLLLASAPQEAVVELPPSKWDAHLLDLEAQAVESAFVKQIELLYGNWMKDFADERVPQRLTVGARNARHAYVKAMTKIEQQKVARPPW